MVKFGKCISKAYLLYANAQVMVTFFHFKIVKEFRTP